LNFGVFLCLKSKKLNYFIKRAGNPIVKVKVATLATNQREPSPNGLVLYHIKDQIGYTS